MAMSAPAATADRPRLSRRRAAGTARDVDGLAAAAVMPEKGRPARDAPPPSTSSPARPREPSMPRRPSLASEQGRPGCARRSAQFAELGRAAHPAREGRRVGRTVRAAPTRAPAAAAASVPRAPAFARRGRPAARRRRRRLVLRDSHGRLCAVPRLGVAEAGRHPAPASRDSDHDARGGGGRALPHRRGAHDHALGRPRSPTPPAPCHGRSGHRRSRRRRPDATGARCAGRQLSGGRAGVRVLDARGGQERRRRSSSSSPAPPRPCRRRSTAATLRALHPARQLQGPGLLSALWGVYPASSARDRGAAHVPEYFRSGGAAPKVLGASEVVP